MLDEGPVFPVLVDQANELGSDEHAFSETVKELGYDSGGVRVSRRSIDASAFAHGKPSIPYARSTRTNGLYVGIYTDVQPIGPISPPAPFVLQEKCGMFSCRGGRVSMQQVIDKKILSRIYGNR